MNEKIDNILSKLDMELWYGAIGDEVYYLDTLLKKPLLTIKLTKNNIKFYFNEQRLEMVNNLGLTNLVKKERIYFYEKVEKYMLDKIELENKLEKENLLRYLGLTEAQMAFLVTNCQAKIE